MGSSCCGCCWKVRWPCSHTRLWWLCQSRRFTTWGCAVGARGIDWEHRVLFGKDWEHYDSEAMACFCGFGGVDLPGLNCGGGGARRGERTGGCAAGLRGSTHAHCHTHCPGDLYFTSYRDTDSNASANGTGHPYTDPAAAQPHSLARGHICQLAICDGKPGAAHANAGAAYADLTSANANSPPTLANTYPSS
jgi:hypothetical protein